MADFYFCAIGTNGLNEPAPSCFWPTHCKDKRMETDYRLNNLEAENMSQIKFLYVSYVLELQFRVKFHAL